MGQWGHVRAPELEGLRETLSNSLLLGRTWRLRDRSGPCRRRRRTGWSRRRRIRFAPSPRAPVRSCSIPSVGVGEAAGGRVPVRRPADRDAIRPAARHADDEAATRGARAPPAGRDRSRSAAAAAPRRSRPRASRRPASARCRRCLTSLASRRELWSGGGVGQDDVRDAEATEPGDVLRRGVPRGTGGWRRDGRPAGTSRARGGCPPARDRAPASGRPCPRPPRGSPCRRCVCR